MITAILNVRSIRGSGTITFDVITDGSADKKVSTSLEGQEFSTIVQGNAKSLPGSIKHTKRGQHLVTLRAESSNVTSYPVLLDL